MSPSEQAKTNRQKQRNQESSVRREDSIVKKKKNRKALVEENNQADAILFWEGNLSFLISASLKILLPTTHLWLQRPLVAFMRLPVCLSTV